MPDINVSTVYRTLELLVSLDLVVETRLEGSAATTRCRRSRRTTTSCVAECGAVEHFGDELLQPVSAELAARGPARWTRSR